MKVPVFASALIALGVLFGLMGIMFSLFLYVFRERIIAAWGRSSSETRHLFKVALDIALISSILVTLDQSAEYIITYSLTYLVSAELFGEYLRGTEAPTWQSLASVFASSILAGSLAISLWENLGSISFAEETLLTGSFIFVPSVLIVLRTVISEMSRGSYAFSLGDSRFTRAALLLPNFSHPTAKVYVELARSKGYEIHEIWVTGSSLHTYTSGLKVRSGISKPPFAADVFDLILCVDDSTLSSSEDSHLSFVQNAKDLGFRIKKINSPAMFFDAKSLSAYRMDELWSEIFRDRREFKLDLDDSALAVTDSILVTGGAGSIGSTLVQVFLEAGFTSVHVVDNSELAIYDLSERFAEEIERGKLEIHYSTVGDLETLRPLVTAIQPVAVFHAAASKHVSIVERNPELAFQTNVVGTLNIIQCLANTTKYFTLVSTDKAVYPENFMGATKRMAEVLVAKARSRASTNGECLCRFSVVRFGNVFGSSGSAPLKFIDQIVNGSKVTLTDERMERYFMSIIEACYLVAKVSISSKEVSARPYELSTYVLDMGAPIRILELIKSLIELSGKTLVNRAVGPNEIEIEITGSRPGEKLFEELSHSDTLASTQVPGVWRVQDEQQVDKTRLLNEFANVYLDDESKKDSFLRKFWSLFDSLEGKHGEFKIES